MKSVYTGGEKVTEFENYNELRVGENKPAFIYEGNELVYPNPVKDGLVLWYDFSGRTNTDGQRGIAEDLSGNGNHGTLQNFNYTSESGYDKNKLLFDGVDDNLQVPETDLNPQSMSVIDNGKIYSYEGDIVSIVDYNGVVKTGNVNISKKITPTYPKQYQFTSTNTLMYDNKAKGGSFVRYENITITGISSSIYVFRGEGEHYQDIEDDAPVNWSLYARANKAVTINNVLIGTEWTKVAFNHNWNKVGNLHIYIKTEETGVNLDISGFKIERGSTNTPYSPAPQDYQQLEHRPKLMQDLLLYNRPLTPEEIAHNYAIEKERFNIE